MASATGMSSSGGRRKSLDAEINLVPFIDLLSMCICFLLMTAVWIEVGAVQVKQAKGTEAAATTSDQSEVEARFLDSSSVEVSIKKPGKPPKKQLVKAPTHAQMLLALDEGLKAWPEAKSELVGSAMIVPKSGVSYGDLVGVMDVFRKNRIVNLGVVPVNGSAI